MSKPINTLEYKPYRGECEVITEVTIAKIDLHPEYIEIKCFYRFKELLTNDVGETSHRDNFVKVHVIMKRVGIEILRSVRVHEDDKTHEECPIIEITSPQNRFNILCQNAEADVIMKSLRHWILG